MAKGWGMVLVVVFALLGGTAASADGRHEGVATCGGSTCHGRQVADPQTHVRQTELLTWQDESGVAGSHSRAWRVLTQPRARAIGARLDIGAPEKSAECIGCHGDPATDRGERFVESDGVGCEACHGGSQNWLASHTRIGVGHRANVAAGMVPLDDVTVKAKVCLDCHFGSDKPGQFVTHRVMAAGHPRIAFELDLFTALQKHHDEDRDYRDRGKQVAGGVKTWAVGQALALDRSLTLFQWRGLGGAVAENYFFDCRSCHRSFSDAPDAKLGVQANPLRPVPPGAPVFNDENMIMLGAATRAVDPALAARLDSQSRALHVAMGGDRAGALRAAATLAATSRGLAARFAASDFDRAQTAAMLRDVLGGIAASAYTDYQGGAQGVMAADTLITAMVADGQLSAGTRRGTRGDLDRAYAAVRDANAYRSNEFRAAMSRVAVTVGVAR